MTFDEAMKAIEDFDLTDAKSHGKIYNKYFDTKLDERYFQMLSDPASQSIELITAILDDEQIVLDLRETENYDF